MPQWHALRAMFVATEAKFVHMQAMYVPFEVRVSSLRTGEQKKDAQRDERPGVEPRTWTGCDSDSRSSNGVSSDHCEVTGSVQPPQEHRGVMCHHWSNGVAQYVY